MAPQPELAKNSPYMETYLENKIPVLYISVNIEEMIFMELRNYQGFDFANIESHTTQVPDVLVKDKEDKKDQKDKKEKIPLGDEESF